MSEPRELTNARAMLRRRGLTVRTEGQPRDWWHVPHEDRHYRIERNRGVLEGWTDLTLDELQMIVDNL